MHRQELHHRARLMRLLLSKIRGDICVWPIIPDSSRITIPGAHDPCRRCDDPGGHVVDEAMQLRWPLKHRRHGIAVSSNPDGVEVAKTLLEQVRRFPSALSRNPLARRGETMTAAAMATYAYDQIDQARTGLGPSRFT